MIKNYIRIYFFALVVSSFLAPSTLLHAADAAAQEHGKIDPKQLPPEVQAELKKMKNDFLEEKIQPTLRLFEGLDANCEHLAQVVNNNQLRNIDKKMVIKHISKIRNTIQEIKKGSYVVVDPYSIKVLLDIAQAYIDHMRNLVYYNLKTLEEPNLQMVIKRSMAHDDIDFEKIDEQISQCQQNMALLVQETQMVGLSFMNRSYRTLENFYTRYNLGKKAFLTGLGCLFGYQVIANSKKEWFDKKTFIGKPLSKIKDWIGDTHNKHGNKILEPNKDATIVAKIHYVLEKIGFVNLAVPTIVTWPLLVSFYPETWQEFKNWCSLRWEGVRSYLRGGPGTGKIDFGKKEPRATLDDIIGKDHIKETFQLLIDYIRNPERFDRAGIAPSPGYLLYGPPGSGKTFVVEALAGSARKLGIKFEFLVFSAADVQLHGLDTIIKYAKLNAPCIVFIDEIHLCSWQNERDGAGLANALTALSGCMNISSDSSKTVIIIGATNNPENIDKALKRRGRFGEHLYSDYPTYDDRLNYLVRELENRTIMSIKKSYLEKLAHETDRCTFEDLKAILTNAMQKAKNRSQSLEQDHLEEAFDETIRHIISDAINLPDDQKKILATHQAGHVLARLLLDKEPHLTKVTIKAINTEIKEESIFSKYNSGGKEKTLPKQYIEYGKIFSSKPQHNDTIKTHEEVINELKNVLAGHIAEKILLGSSGYCYHGNERAIALNIARYVVYEGMYEDQLPKETRNILNKKAYELLEACEKQVTHLLETHKQQLKAIADALEEKLTLTSVDLMEILKINDEPVEENK
ncbi:MAG: AAA family ATPase [Candidatus Babeliales bacterium]